MTEPCTPNFLQWITFIIALLTLVILLWLIFKGAQVKNEIASVIEKTNYTGSNIANAVETIWNKFIVKRGSR
jgi:uncharacterized protein involved in cysteine biosynthesis